MIISTPYFTDLIVLIAGLLLHWIVTAKCNRSADNVPEYILGEPPEVASVLTAHILGGCMSAPLVLYTFEKVYQQGWYFVLPILGSSIGLWLTGIWGTSTDRLLGQVSAAEAVKDQYRPLVRLVIAAYTVLQALGVVALQLRLMSHMLSMVTGFQSQYCLLVAAIVALAYTSLRGAKQLTVAHFVQFYFFGTLLPELAYTIWDKVHDLKVVEQVLLSSPWFDTQEMFRWTPDLADALVLMLYFAVPSLNPTACQCIAMGKDTQQVRRAFKYAAGMWLCMMAFVVWITVLLLADNTAVTRGRVVSCLISHYAFAGTRGFFALGIMAMALTTADAWLSVGAVALVNDMAPLHRIWPKTPLQAIRSTVWIIGSVACLLAWFAYDSWELLLLISSLHMPVVTVPLLCGVWGWRVRTHSVLISMVVGNTTVLLWTVAYGFSAASILLGMLAHFISLRIGYSLQGKESNATKKGPLVPVE